MTYKEWCEQTQKMLKGSVPKFLVHEVIACAIRAVIEEFLANPADADLNIEGIGRFYMNHRVCHQNFRYKGNSPSGITEQNEQYLVRWTIHFTPYKKLKDVMNGRMDAREMLLGGCFPLYPEYMLDEKGYIKRGRKAKIKPPRERYVVKTTRKKKSTEYINRWMAKKKLKEQENQESDDE